MQDVSFDYDPSIRIVLGRGALGQLGELARELAGPRALLVTDPGLVESGLANKAQHALATSSIATSIFADVRENPTTAHVEAGVQFAREHGPIDLIVALGGGSAMDCAKGINFVLTNGGQMQDYQGHDKAPKPMLPSIGIPTTAGTGSEAQSYALIARADTHEKMACGDRKARFRIAILDPTLTASAPQSVRAASGIDALAHAIESYVTTRRTPLSQMFARQAWRLLAPNFAPALKDPNDLDAASAMLLGANLAGTAIENSMLGAAHATANPLTAHYNIAHGHAVALMLPHVIRLNGQVVDPLYADLCAEVGLEGSTQALAKHIDDLKALADLPLRLSDHKINSTDLPTLAKEATAQWTGTFNPQPLDETTLLHLYESAY